MVRSITFFKNNNLYVSMFFNNFGANNYQLSLLVIIIITNHKLQIARERDSEILQNHY